MRGTSTFARIIVLGCLLVAGTVFFGQIAPAQQQPANPAVAPGNPPPIILGGQLPGGRAVGMQPQPGQLPPVPGTGNALPREGEFTDAISLATDRQAKRRLEAAEDCLKSEDWGTAARLIQKLLENAEDTFLQIRRKDAAGNETLQWTSVRSEANQLLKNMPKKGLEFYELQYGSQAKSLLTEAKKKGDPQLLTDIAQQYLYTEAGIEALNLLGTQHLDRGRPLLAALCFDRLFQRVPKAQAAPGTLLKAVLAFRQGGDPQQAEQCWKALMEKTGRDGMRLGDQNVSLTRVRQVVDTNYGSPSEDYEHQWLLFRGSPGRSASGSGSVPILRSRLWQRSILPENQGPDKLSISRQWIQEHLAQAEGRLPGSFPVIAGGRVVYRSYRGVEAVDARTGEFAWRETPSPNSLDAIALDAYKRQEMQKWLPLYRNGNNSSFLFENSTIGTLSTDNERVYFVDDLPLPPHPTLYAPLSWNGMTPSFGHLQNAAHQSHLQALDLNTGKLIWAKGDRASDSSDLAGSYFLGPPLPLGGKLYVLTEKNSQFRLACLEANKGDVLWIQTLATARDKLLMDAGRRIHAAHLAYGDGVLVCPTNAGAILGVDLLSHSLVWAYPYRDGNATQPQRTPGPAAFPGGAQFGPRGAMPQMQQLSAADWKTSAPAIADGKVVFAAPDGMYLHCLNIRDGSRLWVEERKDDLYLAGVFQEKVLLVGKNAVRALNLADGKPLWRLDTGAPSGQGVASGKHYYLPLRKGEVCKIDLDRGTMDRGQTAVREEVPGNLLFFEDRVISQTETHLSAYEHVDAKLARAERDLQKNPKDPAALLERGELRLYQGDLPGAVVDLRQVSGLSSNVEIVSRTRSRLYEALTELLQRDWAAGEKYLDEFKDLSTVRIPPDANSEDRARFEAEHQRRQERLLYLTAKGREQQGRLLEAFQAYVDYSALSNNQELVGGLDDTALKTRPDLWVQGRIQIMIVQASPEQRKQLESEIVQRWRQIQDSNDLDGLRRFVSTFGSLFSVGREAQLVLAERLMEENAYLEAELHLRQLRGLADEPRLAAQAVYSLARLLTRRGLLEDAVQYYRVLQREFPAVLLRDGRPALDHVLELASDKRFLLYLDEVAPAVEEGALRASEVSITSPYNNRVFPFDARGEMLPSLQRYRLALVQSLGQASTPFHLALFENDTGEERWSHPLGGNMSLPPMNAYPSLRPNAVVLGHLLVFQLGTSVFAFDLLERKKLWDRSLLGSEPYNPQSHSLTLDKDGSLMLVHMQGTKQKLGQLGPVTASYVCLKTRDGLVVVDPIRGTDLWTKSDVTPQTEVFGNEQLVFSVEAREDRAGNARAYRGQDGAPVTVPDFAAAYQRKLRVLGDRLLVSRPNPAGGFTLALYEVRTGKEPWTKSFPSGSTVLRSEDADLLGVVEPQGRCLVVDLNSLKETECAGIKPEHLEKLAHGLLLQDRTQWYVALGKQAQPSQEALGPWSNLIGLHDAQVDGMVYAFERGTGALNWRTSDPIERHRLLLDQFQDLPMLVFTCNSLENVAVGRTQNVARTQTVDKRTGKLLWDRQVRQQPQFHSIKINRPAGTYDLISKEVTLRHSLENGTR